MVRWLPLESNPEVMNKFLEDLGVPATVKIHDVLGLDDELLAMVPQPACAMLLLYPITPKSEEHQKSEEEELTAAGQSIPEEVFFMKQFVGNACGTVALLHALANNEDKYNLPDGPLKKFLQASRPMNPEERGRLLEEEEAIGSAHESCAAEGQTRAPDRETNVNEHFIAFVNVGGKVYELDGRKKFPVSHGDTTSDTFLQDAARAVRGFMSRDPDCQRFAAVAMVAE